MRIISARHVVVAALACAVAVVVPAQAQQPQPPHVQQPVQEPQVGQPGKDVVWVPTAGSLVDKMLDLAHVTAADVVIDLGSGDGRTVIAAARRGARALGIEYNPSLVELSRRRAADEHVANATFQQGDLFEADLSPATVITMFLLPQINLKLRPRLLDLKPGTRIVSNTFTMDDWSPDDEAMAGDGCSTWCTALLWIVPAKVEGTWRSNAGVFTLTQRFQMLEGTLDTADGQSLPVSGKLRGADVVLNANGTLYEGRAQDSVIQGTVTSNGAAQEWIARR